MQQLINSISRTSAPRPTTGGRPLAAVPPRPFTKRSVKGKFMLGLISTLGMAARSLQAEMTAWKSRAKPSNVNTRLFRGRCKSPPARRLNTPIRAEGTGRRHLHPRSGGYHPQPARSSTKQHERLLERQQSSLQNAQNPSANFSAAPPQQHHSASSASSTGTTGTGPVEPVEQLFHCFQRAGSSNSYANHSRRHERPVPGPPPSTTSAPRSQVSTPRSTSR